MTNRRVIEISAALLSVALLTAVQPVQAGKGLRRLRLDESPEPATAPTRSPVDI